MAGEFKLELEKRSDMGRQAVRRLRKEGKVPGIFYSGDSSAVPFYVDLRHLHEALQSDSHVYAVKVRGKIRHAIFKELQYHPVTDEILHADLFGVSLKDRINIMVPVILEGEAPGVKAGGVLTQNLMDVEIRCLATDVPDAVHIDVEQLELGDTVHVEDLDLGDIEILTHPEVTIVSVQAPKEEIVEEEVEEEVEEAEAEGEEPGEEAEAPPSEKQDKTGEDKGSSK